jgi:hypothetical protein
VILPAEVLSAALRLLVVILVYLFLFQVVRALLRDLRMSATQGPPVLYLVPADDRAGRPITIRSRVTIGRGPDTDISVPDEFLSTEHAAIFWRDGQWWIADLGSTNGTLHNGRPVVTDAALHPGDTIQLGGLRFRIATADTA